MKFNNNLWRKNKMNFFKTKEEINKIEEEVKEPVELSVIEDVIDLINVASKVKCAFQLHLTLSIGDFKIDNDNFEEIKLLNKNKKESNKLIITYKDVLLSNQTTIDTENIIHIEFFLKYKDKGNDINV